MMTPRIFVGADGAPPEPGADYALPAAAARHVAQALRMRAGDTMALFTGTGGEYAARIVRIDRRGVVAHVDRHAAIERESPSPLMLAQAVIAADMMDFVVRKADELGVATIVPILAERTQSVPADRLARRAAHWRQIAVAACEQCGRNRIPDVLPVVDFATWIAADDVRGRAIAILDATAERSLAAAAASRLQAIAVGPEGGFTPGEVARAAEQGATRVHLGSRVLRAETAALAALATVNAIAGDAR
jgi:16S rRNA (uracil1498-N3)-methyltransferase